MRPATAGAYLTDEGGANAEPRSSHSHIRRSSTRVAFEQPPPVGGFARIGEIDEQLAERGDAYLLRAARRVCQSVGVRGCPPACPGAF